MNIYRVFRLTGHGRTFYKIILKLSKNYQKCFNKYYLDRIVEEISRSITFL